MKISQVERALRALIDERDALVEKNAARVEGLNAAIRALQAQQKPVKRPAKGPKPEAVA